MSSRDRLYATLRALALGASVTSTIDPAAAQNLLFTCTRTPLPFNEDALREIIRTDDACAAAAMQRLVQLTRGSEQRDHPGGGSPYGFTSE